MDSDVTAAFEAHWSEKAHTKADLEAFGKTLNPPVELSVNDTTGEMVAECLRHCEANRIALAYDAEAGAWKQATALIGDEDSGPAIPSPEPNEIPRADEPQEEPAASAASPRRIVTAYAGVPAASDPPPEPVPSGELGETLDELERLLKLPPAHQNFINDAERSRCDRGKVLVARLRELTGTA